MTNVRQPAVAGTFYPAQQQKLRSAVRGYLASAEPTATCPKALIVPHAGYVYSGAVAGSGYARLAAGRGTIRRVVLLGPAHRAYVDGLAASSADSFGSPLGTVPVDKDAVDLVLSNPLVQVNDAAHASEHSLEVQLPFLQEVLDEFTLVPLLTGQADTEDVTDVIVALWGGEETAIVVSSDLSHYHDYETATRLDRVTSSAIEALKPQEIGHRQACGYTAIRGLLGAATGYGLTATTIDLRNSADTAGPRNEVVGYCACVFQ